MKRRISQLTLICSYLLALCLIFPQPAHAYLDPGTGSYILQVLLAALLGIGLVLKIYWTKVTGFFKRLFAGKNAAEDERGEKE